MQPDRIQPLPLPDEIIEASIDLVDPSPYQMRIDAYEDEEDTETTCERDPETRNGSDSQSSAISNESRTLPDDDWAQAT